MNKKGMQKTLNWLDKRAHFLFTLFGVCIYLMFLLYPVLKGVTYSLTDWNGLDKKYNFIGIKNYMRLFSDKRIIGSISFTFKYTFVLVFFTVVISLFLALLLNRKIKFRAMIRTVYFFPAVLSMITVGLIWNQIFLHALPSLGKALGIASISKNILANPTKAFYGIVCVSLWQGVAIPTVLFMAGLQSVPKELLEAASIDGASRWVVLRKIIFPYLVPVLNMVVILTVKGGLTAFDQILAMTNGGPNKATESLGLLIYNFAFVEFKFSYANALAVCLFILIGLISFIQVKTMNKHEVS